MKQTAQKWPLFILCIITLCLMRPMSAEATSYISLGLSRVDFEASDFDREYVVDRATYNHIEFSTDLSDRITMSGIVKFDATSKDIQNAYLRLGLENNFIGYMSGEISGEIIHDSGRNFGTFDSEYQHFYIGKHPEGADTLSVDQISLTNATDIGLAYTQYSIPYLFSVGKGDGRDVPAVQDDNLHLKSLGFMIDYNPVRAKTLALQNQGGTQVCDWYFATHLVMGLTYAEASDEMKEALGLEDATWWGVGMNSSHYELGWFYAQKTEHLTVSMQIGYFLRGHYFAMTPVWDLGRDLDQGEVAPPEVISFLHGPLAKVTIAW